MYTAAAVFLGLTVHVSRAADRLHGVDESSRRKAPSTEPGKCSINTVFFHLILFKR